MDIRTKRLYSCTTKR